jgi:hypothetical protein
MISESHFFGFLSSVFWKSLYSAKKISKKIVDYYNFYLGRGKYYFTFFLQS